MEFGKEGHRIEFSAIGSGFVERTMDERALRGGAMCRIDRGDGQFAGVRGIVASLFSIDVRSRIMVRHFVIIRGAEPGADAMTGSERLDRERLNAAAGSRTSERTRSDETTLIDDGIPRAGRSRRAAEPRARHTSDTRRKPAVPRVHIDRHGIRDPEPLRAGRYEFKLNNAGESPKSHTALGKIPDRVTDAEYDEWMESLARSDGQDGQTDAMTWDDIEFIGIPDWPEPGGFSSGVIDLQAGRYFLFDPFSGRGYKRLMVDGAFGTPAEPESDLTVTLEEMAIEFPDAALTTQSVRWKIENAGAFSHEVAVIPISPGFTEEHLQMLFAMPEDATPPPGMPELVLPARRRNRDSRQGARDLARRPARTRTLPCGLLPTVRHRLSARDGWHVSLLRSHLGIEVRVIKPLLSDADRPSARLMASGRCCWNELLIPEESRVMFADVKEIADGFPTVVPARVARPAGVRSGRCGRSASHPWACHRPTRSRGNGAGARRRSGRLLR